MALGNLRELRLRSGLSEAELEEQLIIGPGWVRRWESGEVIPRLDVLLSLLSAVGASPEDLLRGVTLAESDGLIERDVRAAAHDGGIRIHFPYAKFDATYELQDASVSEFDQVIESLRDGLARLSTVEGAALEDDSNELAKQIKTDAVADSFLTAVSLWPGANPSDIWWFLVSRAYLDAFNHPAEFARLDLGQSWKRTGGWALEKILVAHYAPELTKHGIRLFIASSREKERLVSGLSVSDRLEPDKIDIVLTGDVDGRQHFFGVVHVKASFAERRTDDVPMSRTLIEAGYCSPLLTMDCKSTPATTPYNRGELGATKVAGDDTRSAKRRDFEEDGYFSACFSYNKNTLPTPLEQTVSARIYSCNFSDPNDAFTHFVCEEWARVQKDSCVG
jgi:transcriptional regulator with XRE-family HTH domain